jgi:hypothetical protein
VKRNQGENPADRRAHAHAQIHRQPAQRECGLALRRRDQVRNNREARWPHRFIEDGEQKRNHQDGRKSVSERKHKQHRPGKKQARFHHRQRADNIR